MSDVSVIGCGNMGSALIRALRDAGRDVTVWNRTRDKAEALVGPTVTVADSVGEALAASPITLVSLTTYEAARELLEGEKAGLSDTILVQLSSGEPAAVREFAEFVAGLGGRYVDGCILAYPKQVGTESLLVLYSGDHEAFDEARALLDRLGGIHQFVGEAADRAAVREAAVLVPFTSMVVGVWQGAKLCQIEGVPLEWYSGFVQQAFPPMIEDALAKAEVPDAATPANADSTVRQAEKYTGELVDYLDDIDLDPGVLEAIHRLYAAGMAEGRAEHDMCCVADLHADRIG